MKKTKSHFIIIPILLASLILFNSSKDKQDSSSPDKKTGTVTDADGNVYKTVIIGNQEWMAENLRTTKFNDGAEIPNVTGDSEWAALSTPGYCWFLNGRREKYAQPYGALYNWHAVETGKLCPEGWKVPTVDDFRNDLRIPFSNSTATAGGPLKATGTKQDGSGLWQTPNEGATNESGFSAVPNGRRNPDGKFSHFNYQANIWSSSLSTDGIPWRLSLGSHETYYRGAYQDKGYGFGVRCVRRK